MTKVEWRSKVAAPAFAALLALSCGSGHKSDGPLDAGRGGADGSIATTSDARDAMNSVGAGGTSASGGASGTGSGGTAAPPDGGGPDLPPTMPDAGPDVIDAGPPDLPIDRVPDVAGCPASCAQLPHVRAGAYVPCIGGTCVLPTGSCDDGFAHCSATPNIGCEADLSQSPNCGYCGTQCYGDTVCRSVFSTYECLEPCLSPTPTACDFSCIDLQTDTDNCGTCGHSCFVFDTQVACQQGKCVTLGCTDPTVADCTSDPGCETTLGSDSNCGGCNDPACTLANTMFTCSDGLGCTASVCQVGFANCNASSADCETAVATTTPTSGGCVPQYVGTVGLATQQPGFAATAIAPDGSFFIGGTYQQTVDFDPSSGGKDIRTAQDIDGYVTKFNADGSYAWTATLAGRGDLTLQQLAIAPGGGVIVAGSFQDTVDLDPSAAQDIHFTADTQSQSPFVVQLAAGGTEVWGRTFDSTDFGSGGTTAGITLDAAGAVYLAGAFSGTIDLDPGAGTDIHMSPLSAMNAFLVKLTSSGARTWSRVVDNAGCSSTPQALTVATDGSAWVTGSVNSVGDPCALTPPNNFNLQTFLFKVDAAGDPPTFWTLGETSIALAAGRGGAIYIGGMGAGAADMDPGPGVARRWLGSFSDLGGFVAKLAADGTYQWSRVLSAARIAAMVPAPDGGVLAIGVAGSGFVSRLSASGASLWTIPLGNDLVAPTSGAANATTFSVAGTSSGTQDFDPGPAIDLLFGDIAFVSRFNF